MADIKISDLPQASTVSDADIVVINQGSVTKTATRGLINAPSGTLPVANGGTGQTTAQAALNALAGGDTLIVSYDGYPLVSNGTNVFFDAINLGAVGATSGVLPVNRGGVGAASLTGIIKGNGASAMSAADSGTDYIAGADASSYKVTVLSSTNITPATGGTTPTQLTFDIGIQPAIDGHTIALGDILCLTNQADLTSRGPWVVTTVGTGSAGMVLARPNWFSTTTARAGIMMSASNGTAEQGKVVTIYPQTATDAGIVLGTTAFSLKYVFSKTGLPVASGGTGVVTLTSGSLLKGNETNAISSATAGTDYVVPSGSITGTAGNVTGIVAVANGGTGASTLTGIVKGTGTTALVAATSGTDYVPGSDASSYRVTAVSGTNITPTVATGTQLIFAAGIQPDVDGHPIALNDNLLFTAQTDTTQRGPWTVTTVGTASVGMVLTRPNWFSTNTARSGILVSVSSGLSDQGNFWVIYSASPVDTGITLGTTTLGTRRIGGKSTFAVSIGGTGATTFTSGALLKGNGISAISAATAGTDYVVPSGDITGTSANVTGTVAIANGGTGATDAATARTNLGITGGTPTDVQIFSTTGTWTKPAGAKSVHVQLFGGGAGGGGGRKDNTPATAKVGGAGGGGGSYLNVTFSEAAFASTENIIIGAGGTSGIANTGGNGGGGGAGGNTSFGALICPGGTAGGGGTTVAAGAGVGILNANAGGGSSATVAGGGGFPSGSTSIFMYGGAGGAGGGGVTVAGAATTGGAGGRSSVLNQAGGALGAAGTAGGNGYNNNAASTNGLFAVGSGGGGGGGGLGVSGGNGGTGGFPAGGGGGGGGSDGGTISGAGGAGGNGLAIITTYF